MTITSILLKTAVLTLLFEAITVLFRFGFGLRSSECTEFLQEFTFHFRIHHGYVGLVLLVLTLALPQIPLIGWILAAWIGLVLSDVIHHFLVLWPVTGSHEFDIFYSS